MSRYAAQSYQRSTKLSKYKTVAQKYDQYIGHFAEDPNISKRWIWELIQNAKDVPNEFGRVKIKITINDNSLEFAHNGDPFRGSDLESIVNQYSSKNEQNKVSVNTTGKYGTGFITTYFLSRKVVIKGIIKNVVNPLNFSDQQSSQLNTLRRKPQKKVKRDNTSNPNQISTKKNIKKQIQQVLIKQEVQQQESKEKRHEIFSPFEITLDRQYKTRKQLAQKLMIQQEKNLQILRKLHQKEGWQRTQQNYDTSFTYCHLDKAAFNSIAQGVKSVQDMFPYALLFNSDLYQICIIDNRKKNKIPNLTIKKKYNKKMSVLNIISCSIKKGQKQEAIDFAYATDLETNSIVCVPIQITSNKISVLSINKQITKIFKQFPLLGCQDTGYNFVFTSRNFYPNQSRSQLKLKHIQGRQNSHANENKRVLRKVFELGVQLYKMLANNTNEKIANFYNLKYQELFEESQKYFDNFADQISQLNIIPKQGDNKKISLKDVVYLKYSQENSAKISNEMNQLFQFLFDNKISKQTHAILYENININTWQHRVKFVNLSEALELLAEIGYKQLCIKFKYSGKLHQYFVKLYSFLEAYQLDQYRTYGSKFSDIKFILTNKNEMKSLNQLKQKNLLPKIYEDIAQQLGIDIQKNLIKDSLIQYFNKVPKFEISDMEQQFDAFFQIEQGFISDDKLKLLLRFCKTVNIGTDVIELASQLLDYADIQGFYVDIRKFKQFKQFNNQKQNKYVEVLLCSFLLNFQQKILKSSDFTILSLSQRFKPSQKLSENFIVNWWNQLLTLQQQFNQFIINDSISMKGIIKPIKQLFALEFTPTQQQLNFTYLMSQIYNKRFSKFQKTEQMSQIKKKQTYFENMLVHPEIRNKSIYCNMSVQQFFSIGLTIYEFQWLDKVNLVYFLNFYDRLVAESIKNPSEMTQRKLKLFQKIRKERHIKLLQIIDVNEQEAGAIYHLSKNHQSDLPALQKLLQKYDKGDLQELLQKANK